MPVETQEIPPRNLPPIRYVDVGSGGQDRVGGFTVVKGRIVGRSGGISRRQAEELERQRSIEASRRAEELRLIEEAKARAEQERIAKLEAIAEQQRREQEIGAIKIKYGTSQQFGETPFQTNYPIITVPTIIQRVVDTKTINGRQVPIVETVVATPPEGGVGGVTERPATKEEFDEISRELIIPEDKNILEKTFETSKGIQQIREIGRKELIKKSFIKKVGDIEGEIFQKTITKTIPLTETLLKDNQIKTFTSGVVQGVVPSTKQDVLITTLSFGGGALFGAGSKATSIGLSKIPRVGSTLSTISKVGFVGGGAVLTTTAIGTGINRIIESPTIEEKGIVLGEVSREFYAFGKGFGFGEKSILKGSGFLQTRGRDFIPLETLTTKEVFEGTKGFPTAPKGKHLSLFKRTAEKFPELTGKQIVTKLEGYTGEGFKISTKEAKKLPFKYNEGLPGGFHTSPGQVAKLGIITPKAGTSEIPGLFISSFVSPHFAKLGKSSGQAKLPTFKDLFAAETSPTISFIQPKRFRVSKTVITKPFEIEGQTFRRQFIKPAKEGVADIPLLKTEIEAILRVNSGTFSSVPNQNKFFTEIEGVRVPIDKFKFQEGTGKDIKVKLKPGEKIKNVDKITSSLPQTSRGRPFSSPKISSSLNPPSIISSPRSSRTSSNVPKSSSKVSSIRSSASSLSSSLKSSRTSSIRSSLRSSRTSSKRSSVFRSIPEKTNTILSPPPLLFQSKKKKRNIFGVEVRRGGKFKYVREFSSLNDATNFGKDYVDRTLAATFKITKTGTTREALKTPKGFRKKIDKKGTLFIEKRGRRISRGGEKKELRRAKNRKKNSKR